MGLCLFAPPAVFIFLINIFFLSLSFKSVMFAVQLPKGKRRANYTLNWSGNVE